MPPIAPLPQQPNRFNVFMEKYTLPILVVVIGTVLSAIFLGKILIVDFNWLMLGLGIIMVFITGYYARYSIKTRKELQKQYDKDIANFKKDVLVFKNDIRQLWDKETEHWNEWAISFSQASDKEHTEHTAELKKQCIEAISDTEQRLDVSVKNAQSIFSSSVQSLQFAVDSYRDQLIHTMKQMDALEERLKKESQVDNTN